jgi:hypothetical protein
VQVSLPSQRRRFRAWSRPILEKDTGDLGEMSGVSRNDDVIVGERNSGYRQPKYFVLLVAFAVAFDLLAQFLP